jgi:hypothetical protein
VLQRIQPAPASEQFPRGLNTGFRHHPIPVKLGESNEHGRTGQPRARTKRVRPTRLGRSQQNGARPGSSCFRLCFRNDPAQLGPAASDDDPLRLPLGDPVTSASASPPAAVVACRRITRIADLRPCSLSPRCFTCIRRSVRLARRIGNPLATTNRSSLSDRDEQTKGGYVTLQKREQ